MTRLRKACAAVLCALAAAGASADTLHDRITYHNDVLYHSFIVDEVSDLVAWTNSYRSGENFDPIVALWHEGQQLVQVDDNSTIAPDQTIFDSGFRLYGLQPGTYLFTITSFANFSNSGQLGDGFRYDAEVPRAVSTGPFVTLNWNLTPAVPEPTTYAMLGVGLLLTGAIARRRARRG